MDQADATTMAKIQWGPRGYAYEHRRFTGRERPGPGGWVVAEGEVYGYSVGYHRTGKKGARLSTEKGRGASFEEALLSAEKAMTVTQRDAFLRRLRSTE